MSTFFYVPSDNIRCYWNCSKSHIYGALLKFEKNLIFGKTDEKCNIIVRNNIYKYVCIYVKKNFIKSILIINKVITLKMKLQV